MLFEFLHNEVKCYGLVNENFQTEKLKIYILDCNRELGYEITFALNESTEWVASSEIENNFPATYANICKRLEEIYPWFRYSKKLPSKLTVA